MDENYAAMVNKWLPLVLIGKLLLIALPLIGGLALYDPQKPIFSFSWKRVVSVMLLAFALYELRIFIFHFSIKFI